MICLIQKVNSTFLFYQNMDSARLKVTKDMKVQRPEVKVMHNITHLCYLI